MSSLFYHKNNTRSGYTQEQELFRFNTYSVVLFGKSQFIWYIIREKGYMFVLQFFMFYHVSRGDNCYRKVSILVFFSSIFNTRNTCGHHFTSHSFMFFFVYLKYTTTTICLTLYRFIICLGKKIILIRVSLYELRYRNFIVLNFYGVVWIVFVNVPNLGKILVMDKLQIQIFYKVVFYIVFYFSLISNSKI